MSSQIEGLSRDESEEALNQLFDISETASIVYEHEWKLGDLVIWDNRCLLHKANGDYPVAEVRYLYRLMLKGERPA